MDASDVMHHKQHIVCVVKFTFCAVKKLFCNSTPGHKCEYSSVKTLTHTELGKKRTFSSENKNKKHNLWHL